MTIREVLARRRRNFLLLAFAAWLGCAGALALSESTAAPPWLFAVAIVGFGAALFGVASIRCPRCRGALGMVNAPFKGKTEGMARRIDFCPYCGVSLDQPYSTGRET